MGFWKEFKEIGPRKHIIRGRELQLAAIKNVIPIPPMMQDKARVCAICRAQFGKMFARNLQPFLVVVREEEKLSFQESNQMVVCRRCIEAFNISDPDDLDDFF